MERCQGPDCDKPAERDGHCRGHRQQKYEGRELTPLAPRKQTRWQILSEAALAYADANAEDQAEWRRRQSRLIMAARKYSAANEVSGATQADGST